MKMQSSDLEALGRLTSLVISENVPPEVVDGARRQFLFGKKPDIMEALANATTPDEVAAVIDQQDYDTLVDWISKLKNMQDDHTPPVNRRAERGRRFLPGGSEW